MLDQLGLDLKWLLAAGGAVIAAAFRYIHGRIVALEEMLRANGSKSEAAHKEENSKLWDALDRHRTDFNSFKDSVLLNNATKGDLQATEKRIMAAIERIGK